MIPQEFVHKYNLTKKARNRYVWTPPSRSDTTQRPGKTPRAVCIPHLKQKPRNMETQQSNNKFYFVSQ